MFLSPPLDGPELNNLPHLSPSGDAGRGGARIRQVTTAEGPGRCRRHRRRHRHCLRHHHQCCRHGEERVVLLFIRFTNCSVRRRRASAGKCKVAQLPGDLTVHVKVGDDYKMVCILTAWQIKRLATSVRRQPAAALSFHLPLFLSLLLPPLPFSHFADRKGNMDGKQREQWRIKVAGTIHKQRDI